MGGIAVLVVSMVGAARWGAVRSSSKSTAPDPMKTDLSVTVSPQPAATSPTSSTQAPRPHTAKPVEKHVDTPKAAPTKTASSPDKATSSNMLIVANGPAPAKTSSIPPTAADATSHASQPPVTITGCLETTVEENEFRLTDTQGADVPKARSWKTGFLKKSATPISLVGFSDTTGLKKLVGHRVSATGTLASGELHLRSYKPTGASCSN